MKDKIFELIEAERNRQTRGLELIASENYVSEPTMVAMGSILTNKYAEGLPGKRYYGGCEVVDEVEQICIDRVKELFGASWANVQPHSGAQANAAVMLACLKPGDKILGFDLSHGGHLTHGSPVNFSGKLYVPSFYGVEKESGRIDFNKIAETAKREKPKLIICGASAYSRDWDYAQLRKIADENGALLMADISHPAGLIASGLLNDPIKHCHIVTTTTHKTLRGPRGGLIMMGSDFPNPMGLKTPKGEIRMMSSVLDSGVFPGTQGGPLEHVIAAKAVAFGEALKPEFKTYAKQVVKNAAVLADELQKRGFTLVTGGTSNHLILADVHSSFGIDGKVAEEALDQIGLNLNKNSVANDTLPPYRPSGIRLGTPAITTRGLKEKDMATIAEWMKQAIDNRENATELQKIREEVRVFALKFPLPSDK